MTRRKRICFWLTTVLAFITILTACLYIVNIRGLLLKPIKQKLHEELLKHPECKLAFGELEILFLPSPHISASQVDISLSDSVSGTVKNLSLFPRILPLLRGRFELAKLLIAWPDLKIAMPSTTENRDSAGMPSTNGEDRSLSAIGESMQAILGTLLDKVPGLHLQIEHGTIDIRHKMLSPILLQELSADMVLPPDGLRMKVECKSDQWEQLAMEGIFEPKESTGNGRIILHHFRSQILGRHFPSGVPKPVAESPIDLDISFSSEGQEGLSATFDVSSPSLTLQTANREAVLQNAALSGTLKKDTGRLEVRLAKLDLDYPRVSLSGEFLSRRKPSGISYHVECKNIDATSVREVALALVGENSVVQAIFQIIRGGKVPLVVFDAQGSSIEELQKSENLLVHGSLQDGELFLEKINLMASEAKGDVLISHGILEGKNLQGRTGASKGRNGALTVALTRGDGPFHLDIEIDADLAQLPPVLSRVVDNRDFLRELALLRDITGRANGRLVLGETLNSVQTRVEVNEWMLKGGFQRLPFPLELQAKSFSYEGSRISVQSLQGRAGRSNWHDISGSLDWSLGPVLELASTSRARISLDELFPWLMTFPEVKDNLWNIESLEGTLMIDSIDFQGPLSRPDDWSFLLKGRLEQLACRSGVIPDILYINSGTITATQQSLQTANCHVACSDASIVASGELSGYMKGLQSADFNLSGTLGPEASGWLSNMIHLPPDLRLRAPLSTTGMRLHWTSNTNTSVSGILQVNGGAEIFLDADGDPRQLSINQLTLKDNESDASLAMKIRETEIDLGFKGNLTTCTLDRLFTETRRFSGSAAGELTAHLVLNHLADSTAFGKLTLKDSFHFPAPGTPLTIDEASLEAKGSVLEVDSANFRLMDTSFEMEGNVGFAEGGLRLDLNLVAPGINWDDLNPLFSLKKSDSQQASSVLHAPFRGTVRLKAGSFTYDNYTWKPLGVNFVFAHDGINIQVTEANLCAIPTPATIIPSSKGQLLFTKLDARNLDLDPTLACLWDRKGAITGVFDLKGEIMAMLTRQNLTDSLEGRLDFVAHSGRVYHSIVLAKIFDLLNVTEIYRGQLPDLAHDGCAYDSIKAGTTLKNGKLLLEDAVFDGLCAKMVASGEIDLKTRKLDITLLVSPLKTVDSLVRNIPLVGTILGGSLVSIPVRVSGDLSSPTVIPLSPSAVGEGLASYMKRAFQLPFKLMQPLK